MGIGTKIIFLRDACFRASGKKAIILLAGGNNIRFDAVLHAAVGPGSESVCLDMINL